VRVGRSGAWSKAASQQASRGSRLVRGRVVKNLGVHLLVGHVAVDLALGSSFRPGHSCSARTSPADGFRVRVLVGTVDGGRVNATG